MPITQDDIRLYASERMTDYAGGGGRMSPTVIVDGLDNNVFPDITDLERITGRVSLRKIFGAAVNADNDTLLNAHALMDDAPDDPATGAVMFAFGGITDERAAAQAAYEATESVALSSGAGYMASGGTSTAGSAIVTDVVLSNTTLFDSNIGDYFIVRKAGLGTGVGTAACMRRLLSRSGNDLTFDAPIPFTSTGASAQPVAAYTSSLKAYGVSVVATAPGAGDSAVEVASILALSAPFADGAAPPSSSSAVLGIDATKFDDSVGRVAVFADGDLVLLHSTIPRAPATQANSSVVNVGRTTLARLRVIGNNGVEHARFTRGVAAPSGVGCTADLDAGTVTFTDVSGMSQPVTVEHRIEEMSQAQTVVGNTLNLNRPLSRAFPAGTKVSSILVLGDLQGRVQLGFAQQAWTATWSDSRIGGEPTADFNIVANPITTTNEGAVTQRWALIFTNTTAYRVIGEFLGEVGIGSTALNYAPINPATGAPYVTIPSAGWGAGWSAGKVYRFNTVGAQAPLWVLRCVAPSLPNPDSDSVTVEFRGYVNT